MVHQLDLPLEVPKEEHIADGVEFTLPRNTFEGVPEDVDLKVKTEVVSIKDKEGKPITLKVYFHLSPPILDTITGQEIKYIDLASFGQADPVRMWFFSIQVANMLTQDRVSKWAWSDQWKGKLRLDEVLSDCLDASFFGNPELAYHNKDNIYGEVEWSELPPEILNEIKKRIESGEPLNYQYLAFLLRNHLEHFKNLPKILEILKKADTETEKSSGHKVEIIMGNYDSLESVYAQLNSFISQINFNIRSEGFNIIDPSFINKWDVGINYQSMVENRIISDIPAVNFTNEIVNMLTSIIDNYYGYEPKKPYSRDRLPFICETIRETTIRRVYDFLKDKDDNSDESSVKFLLGLSLGELASQVCQLRLNNGDRNMRDYLKSRDDSEIKLLAAKGEG